MTQDELNIIISKHEIWLSDPGNVQGESAYFMEKNFAGLHFTCADLRHALFDQCDFTHTTCVNTNFSHANLQLCNFSLASLQYAHLKYAILYGANLRSTVLAQADLHGANCSRILCGRVGRKPATNWQYANCHNVYFYDAYLARMDFRTTELLGAKFHNAYIRRTLFPKGYTPRP